MNVSSCRGSVAFHVLMIGALLAVSLLCSCANTAYDHVLRTMDRPAAVRLADCIQSVASEHCRALEQFERTSQLFAAATERVDEISAEELDICQDELDRCTWWVFNLKRCSLSIQDLVDQQQGVASSDAGPRAVLISNDESVRGSSGSTDSLLRTFARAQAMMDSTAEDLATALKALNHHRESNAEGSINLPDLDALREVIDTASAEANRTTAALSPNAVMMGILKP